MEAGDQIRSSVEANSSEPLLEFVCSICHMKEKCRYGKIKLNHQMQSWNYHEEVYYIMDPFCNRKKTDVRRLPSGSNAHDCAISAHNDPNVRNIQDYFVLGSICTLCGQSVCIDELCSVFYYKTFCTMCVSREWKHFPSEIIEQIEVARNVRKRREDRKGQAELTSVVKD